MNPRPRTLLSITRGKLTILLSGWLLVCPLSPRLHAFGGIVHDPLLMTGMMGQMGTQIGAAGAQIAQMIQTYQLLMEMKERVGSLAQMKNWKAVLRRWSKREVTNLGQNIVMDMRAKGARISAATPTNPVYASLIRGRNTLNKMEYRFNNGTFLSTAYRNSDYDISKQEHSDLRRRQLAARQERQAAADAAAAEAANSMPMPNAPAAASWNVASANAASASVQTARTYSDESFAGVAGNPYTPTPGSTAVGGGARAGVAPLGALGDGQDPGGDDSLANPANEDNSTFDLSRGTGDARALALAKNALATMDGGVIQEFDAAVQFSDQVVQTLAESKEAIDQNDMKGPEPLLAHQIAQLDTIIELERAKLRIARIEEERAQAERRVKEMANGELKQNTSRMEVEVLKASVISAANADKP
jgi:hypothetical protein